MPKGSPVKVGDRYGRLIVTQLAPFRALCDCGTLVENRKAYHLTRNRVRSCGCLARERRPQAVPSSTGRWSSVECIDESQKHVFRRYRVTCARCGATHERGVESLEERPAGIGCITCLARHLSREAVAKRRSAKHA